MRKILLYFSLKYEGDFMKIYNAIKAKEKVLPENIKNVESKINCNYITIIDNNYPTCFKNILWSPFVLFYYGDLSLIDQTQSVSVIGNRKNSDYGKEMCCKLVKELKDFDKTIVSGMALGIDSIAHNSAIENNMKTIAVLGSGIDYVYPKSNKYLYNIIKHNGLIISEYPNSLIPKPDNFLFRNRIIAALSSHIVVIEAKYKSGTMNTVSYGLEYGKDICCVPALGNIESGCNMLIKQGAKLVECAKDIFE